MPSNWSHSLRPILGIPTGYNSWNTPQQTNRLGINQIGNLSQVQISSPIIGALRTSSVYNLSQVWISSILEDSWASQPLKPFDNSLSQATTLSIHGSMEHFSKCALIPCWIVKFMVSRPMFLQPLGNRNFLIYQNSRKEWLDLQTHR